MLLRVFVAALVAVPLLLPTVAPAQSAAVDTQLQLEAKRKRLIVRPEPPVAAGVRDAERAADETAVAEYARQANDPVRRTPSLDYDVSSALTSRNAQKALRR
jgi:hypothetical protein